MAVPSSLIRVPVEMPDRSGHNLSHSNSFTGQTGALIPVLCEELLPNDTVSLGSQLQVQLPPMVTDFYGKVDFVLEAFFCPNRLCWGGWQDFITHPTANPQYPEGTPVGAKPIRVPNFYVPVPSDESFGEFDVNRNSLLHYLDYGKVITTSKPSSVLPAIAYHRIWDDWYRDSRIQAPLFFKFNTGYYGANEVAGFRYLESLPYISTNITYNGSAASTSIGIDLNSNSGHNTPYFRDGVRVDQLRQRNWVKDYFTSASLFPQAGGASEVKFDIDSANESGAFSIATLRSANSLQKWLERNNLAGYRYSDQIYAQFGCYPADAIMDRPLYLGRTVQTVYNRSVFDTTSEKLATKGANSQVIGEGSLVDSFTATEHGFLMVLASLVPRPVYGTGLERMTLRTEVGDFAFPLLAGIGDQSISVAELTGDTNLFSSVFGYTDMYAEYKFRNDKIHGLLADGESLEKYALQRSFDNDSTVELGSDFLQIPTDYLDQVQAVASSEAGYTYWAEIYFPYKKLSTIPAYSQPTLADLKHAHTEYISRGGKRL